MTVYGCGRHEDSRPGLQTTRRVLSGARNIAELRHRRREARRIYEARLAQIESGQVAPSLLIIEQVLSRDIEDYAVQTRVALAARKLRDAGIPAHPGESVGYVIADAKAKDKARRVTIGGGGVKSCATT